MISFLDIETGGWAKEKNALCEIGLIITDDDLNIVNEWQTYIKPYKRPDTDELCSYKPDAMAVNGITMEQLNEGVEIQTAIFILYYQLIKVQTIVCHNVAFDMGWIDYLIGRFIPLRNGQPWGYYTACTLLLSRTHFKGSCSLDDVCDRLGIQRGGHNALGDARACMEVYKRLINK